MPWLAKALLLALKTKRGREVLLAGGIGAVEMARSAQARRLYARAWNVAGNPRPRQKAAQLMRRAARKLEAVRRGS